METSPNSSYYTREAGVRILMPILRLSNYSNSLDTQKNGFEVDRCLHFYIMGGALGNLFLLLCTYT